jgi:biopolymer transport protein ExbB
LENKIFVQQINPFWQQTSWQNGLNLLKNPTLNPFYRLATTAKTIVQEHPKTSNTNTSGVSLGKFMHLDDWLSSNLKSELDNSTKNLQKGLAFLASTGATAPFIGLFGTVWGIYHALMTIGSTGSASLDQVAGPIGEALVMTALGLIVAIPAVLGYNALNKANREFINELKHFADDLHTSLMTNNQSKGN